MCHMYVMVYFISNVNTQFPKLKIVKKVWWHIFYTIHSFHHIHTKRYIHPSPFVKVPLYLPIAGQLSGKNLPGVPSWESNSNCYSSQEKVNPTANIYSQITSLVRLQLLTAVGGFSIYFFIKFFLATILQSANQCCGSGCLSRIPDPDFYPSRIPDLGSRTPDPKTATKEMVKKIFCYFKWWRKKIGAIFKEL